MLELKNICFSAKGETGGVEILRNVDLTIPNGKFIVITGPNGGGKSTLAKVIMGVERPTEGKIYLDGEDITDLSVTERARKGISYGFQAPPRFKGMKVSDLLSCAAGRTLSHDDGCKYLTQVGLCSREYIDRDVDTSLSGGELKRIEIATILAKGGNVMIFDEPEAGIDLWSFSRLTGTFESIHRNTDASIVIISHQERIIRLADEIIMVSDGRITEKGPVEEIFPKILANTTGACSYLEEA
ncbi:MAG: ATP-binding cassette domain-containing protein [Oscillospiraceae bacterium]|nr:ATP-binding cassette domain-containing protein [Oscillospiraceae bacterium]